MIGETKNRDFKLNFDVADESAKVDLVKNLVAIANAGGGEIIFGRDETSKPGVDLDVCIALDSARLDDLVKKYIRPASITLGHERESLENSRFILRITVSAPESPIVMSLQGDWRGMDNKKEKPHFLMGDIWTRHSTKTERISYQDLRIWLERVRHEERDRLLKLFSTVARVPEGFDLQAVKHPTLPIDSAQRLLEYAALRHEYDPSHLLSGKDLVWLFANRIFLKVGENQFGLLIASALRRNPTLYWWLTQIETTSEIVIDELEKCLAASDRDKSDAARSIIELASVYADDQRLTQILDGLRNSDYKHFKAAAQEWAGRKDQLAKIASRIASVRISGAEISQLSDDEIENHATQLAQDLLEGANSQVAKKLGDVTRTIWSRRTGWTFQEVV